MKRVTAAILAAFLTMAVFVVRGQDGPNGVFGTPVGGALIGNYTWTAADSPYWMEDTVTIPPGSSLTIEAGVTVLVDGWFGLGNNGNLSILGEKGNPVTFAPNGTVPDWIGIWSRSAGLYANWLDVLRGSVMMQYMTGARLENLTVTWPSQGNGIQFGPFVDIRMTNITVTLSDDQTGINGGNFIQVDLKHFTVSGGQNGLGLNDCGRCVIADGRVSSVSADGVDFQGHDSTVSEVTVLGGAYVGLQVLGNGNVATSNTLVGQGTFGILAVGSNNVVSNNSVSNTASVGISVSSSFGGAANNTIVGNRIADVGRYGIELTYLVGTSLTSTTVVDNAVRSSGCGLFVESGPGNLFVNNTFRSNGVGVELRSDLNVVHHNHFEFNTVQAIDAGSGNLWSDEYPSGGNWWSDYRGRDLYKGSLQNIPGPDGIGDTPYDIDAVHRDPFPHYTMLAPAPPENVTALAVGQDVNLTWVPGPGPRSDRFLVYRASEATTFDFSAPVANTTATEWTDPGAALSEGSAYYAVRALNLSLPAFSATGNTAGTWTHALPAGRSTFSLPLQPYPWIDYARPGRTDTVGETATDVGGAISYMEKGTWRSVPGGGDPATPLAVGKGYVAAVPTARVLTFSGIPGGMIAQCGFPPCPYAGFDAAGDARNVSASVVGRDVVLRWTTPAGLDASDAYEIRVAWTPAGVLGVRISDYTPFALNASGLPSEEFTHKDAATTGGAWYYLVVPLKYGVWLGSSSYAVGVWMEDLPPGYTALGLPLAPYDRGTYLEPFVSNLSSPALKRVQWFDVSRGDWVARAAWMPPGMYDARWERVMAVEVDAAGPTRIVFVGV